ncbi:MAG: Maf family protein, partial [Candidatus Kerfeldbacteria bacterium]|nr:Maf family protein [Candidatus Kerfeldbacteria bacterium]
MSNRIALPLILGSASVGRRAVLAQAGYVFEVMRADIDEKAIRHPDPSELTVRIASAKADALLPRIGTPSLLITADQVVTWGDEIREKPVDEAQARHFLETVSERPLTMFSAVVVTDTARGRRTAGVDRAHV